MTIAKHSTPPLGDDGLLIDPTPGSNVIHIPEFLTDGADISMDVNGSSTPFEFEWAVPAGQKWYLTDITFLIIDAGTMDYNDFGSIGGGLTNGLLIEIKTQGTTYTWANPKTNKELDQLFTGQGGVSGDETNGWLDEDDRFSGITHFSPAICLDGDQGDFVKATVRDNLTGLDEMVMSIRKWRKI